MSAVDGSSAALPAQLADATHEVLRAWGWDVTWAESFRPFAVAGQQPARVVSEERGRYLVATAAGERRAVITGRFRHAADSLADYPAVGDWVALQREPEPGRAGDAVVTGVLPRRSRVSRRANVELVDERVLAANVDRLFIVQALTRDLNPRRLERYLAMAWSSGAMPAVVLNKVDLCPDLPAALGRVEPVTMGAPLHVVSAATGAGLADLRTGLAPGSTIAFMGSSGVGKSTLVNALLGHGRQAVQATRGDDERGRHTTVRRELIPTPDGALLLDSPGMRSLELWEGGDGLERAFADIEVLAASCRFSDCRHDVEPGCAVTAAIASGELPAERLVAQRKLTREQRSLELRKTPPGRAESRRLGKLYRDTARNVLAAKSTPLRPGRHAFDED
ncbi:MAG: ribosome small subunit-dependent GTPase A [Candidatus Limnocylindrales bacterium]